MRGAFHRVGGRRAYNPPRVRVTAAAASASRRVRRVHPASGRDGPASTRRTVMATKAREIMTAERTCANETDTVQSAASTMERLGVGALPICGQDNKLKGMITDRDIVIKVVADGKDSSSVTVGELQQPEAVTIGADDDADEILATMRDHKVRRLPVID